MKKILIPLCVAAFAMPAMGQDMAKPSAADTEAHNKVIQQALVAAAPFKAQVTQYRLHTKAFPTRNEDIGMNLPESYRNYDIRSIAVGANGIIEVTLNATSGVDGGVIRLTPSATGSPEDPTIEWKCTSASYTTVSDATLGVCEHTNQP